jgi:repressor LexA
MTAELTATQTRVLDAIRAGIEEEGFPPSLREIGDASGLSSLSSVHAQLAQLELKGWIRRHPNKPRAIKVLRREEAVKGGTDAVDA